VLDALGYDIEQDVVRDLFPGSGAVGAEVSQTRLAV
jgi:16S rRNA G966 N2-methylase RsmD